MPGSRDISDTQASCPDRVLLTVGAPGPISKQQEYRFTPAGALLMTKRQLEFGALAALKR